MYSRYSQWLNTRHTNNDAGQRLIGYEFKNLKEQYFRELIVEPFIKLLEALVKKGADPQASVDKLEFYRELDKHKQHLHLVSD